MNLHFLALISFTVSICEAWIVPVTKQQGIMTRNAESTIHGISQRSTILSGTKHGEDSCFMPLAQMDQDYYAPRIIQIAGAYPGITAEEFNAVTSEPAAEQGQWSYDFSDPDGPQVGTVAIEGNAVVHACQDPVVIIAEHFAIGVPLPEVLVDAVDIICLVDRANTEFGERKFLVLQLPGETQLTIGAYASRSELPAGATILGRVEIVQIPWLPCMKPTKTGIMECDEYF
mmetsp:Transcript_25645/g.36171  ORF Transcript_25645/g.36171 Transcript_25645/m.36171 type:complete len:230 (-) Transcript_25645:171-860(-)